MNKDHLIYELTDEQRAHFVSSPEEVSEEDRAKVKELREDVARLDGYLKGRADSDLPKLKLEGDGHAHGAGSNADLAG